MRTDLFDFELPQEYIAQQPATPRDDSRLLVLHRESGRVEHRRFHDIGDYLLRGDLLVANDSRVIPARLYGRKQTGGSVELLLLRRLDDEGLEWECLIRGRNLRAGMEISLFPIGERVEQTSHYAVTVIAVNDTGTRIVRFSRRPDLDQLGEIPLPPYITAYYGDGERYQTVYSRPEGSAAAPTAGLHFTPELLIALRHQGVQFETVTLHVGLDTFRPVESQEVEEHVIHSEWAELPSEAARRINATSLAGGRIVAIGTTSARTLEWAATGAQQIDPYADTACPWQRTAAFAGDVNLFIRPGYRFRAVDAMVTNFHLPRSSLLMMVSAFVGQLHPEDADMGREVLLEAYEIAKREGYRFFSFGDAMLIL